MPWEEANAVLIRSPWDCAQHAEAFWRWLDRVERATRVVNPPSLVRWNAHKRYLLELESDGVRIVPSALVPRGDAPDLDALMRERGWAEAVVKPAIGGSSRETVHTGRIGTRDAKGHLRSLVAREDALVQVYLPGVLASGEVSCVYLGGRFSHAVRKRAAPGDWRVQSDFSGTVEPVHAPPGVRSLADAACAAAPPGAAFARVDILLGPDEAPYVLEHELIDPELFLGTKPGSADELAGLILES